MTGNSDLRKQVVVCMGAHGEPEGRGRVLAFWRAVELLSPQRVPALEQERVCQVSAKFSPLRALTARAN